MNGCIVLRTSSPVWGGTLVVFSVRRVVVASLVCLVLLLTTTCIPGQLVLLIRCLILLCIRGPMMMTALAIRGPRLNVLTD